MNARDSALLQIDSVPLPGWPAGVVARRAKTQASPPADPRDRALAEAIGAGVVQHLLTLRHLVAHYSGRKLASIDPAAQKILAVALYQLRHLTRIRPSAVVDEAVEQTRRFRLGRASGFVNAVLRRAVREPEVPLPDRSDLRGYVELVLSHPYPLFEKLEAVMGEADALRLCERHNQPPPTIVRLCAGASIEQLQADGITLTPHQRPRMVVVEGARRSDFARWAAAGIAQAQDPTSAAVVDHLLLRSRISVLDRCCGLGTKTLQIAERVSEDAAVIAIDPSRPRTQGLEKLLEQRGIGHVSVITASMLGEIVGLRDRFDRILIDAPCSNSGVLMRRPEARYAQTDKPLASLRKLQAAILIDTFPRLAPGGRLVYSTCSIWKEENEQLIGELLGAFPHLRRIEEKTTLPSLSDDPTTHHDGGYVAVLEHRPK